MHPIPGRYWSTGNTQYLLQLLPLMGGCFAQFLFTRPLNSVFSQAMPVYGLGIAMALLSTVAPAFLLALGIRHIGASRASLISSIGPITTIFLAYFFLNEPMSVVQLFGSALVLAGVLLVSL